MSSTNLIQNHSFETPGDAGVARAWRVTGPCTASLDSSVTKEGSFSQKIQRTGSDTVVLSQTVHVSPGTDYYFSGWVKSDERVVARIGQLSMSYTGGVDWQKLAGFFRTATETTVTLEFRLGGLTPHNGTVWVDEVVFKTTALPAAAHRKLYGSTSLIEEGKPVAWIVYPATIASYRALAEKVQDAVAKATGVTLPLAADVEATEAGTPVLKEPYRSSNLILLGRLGINRALWAAYGRYMDATDGYYPGGNGYVVRTAANVLRNGKNHIILGGSTEKGAEDAVHKYCEIVQRTPLSGAAPKQGWLSRLFGTRAPATLTLPWLLDVRLDGECLAAFQANDKLWRESPGNVLLPRIEPGYGTVLRWYQNAMGFYWSGWPNYKERADQHLELVLKDKAYTHQYPLEFFVRVYDMLDDSGLLTKEQVAAVDNLLLQNFWDFSSGELSWMTEFSPPYDAIRIVNRHQIAPWMSDLVLADFIHDYLDVTGEFADVVEFRRQEKDRFLADVIKHRWTISQPSAGYGSGEEVTATFFRYALGHDRYEFFTNGNARRCAEDMIARISNISGGWVRPAEGFDHQLISGIVASYYGDGRFKNLLQLPSSLHPSGTFMGRYINGVHRYVPGDEVKAEPANNLTGVTLPPMMPHNYEGIAHLSDPAFQPVPLKPQEMLDLAVFRSGFSRDDDDVVFSGARDGGALPQLLLHFASRGVVWFAGSGTEKYFDQNAVSVQRTDRWLTGQKHYAAAARLDWVSNLNQAGAISSTLSPFMDTSWRCEIVWIRPGLYVVRDVVTALESGQYGISVGWRPAGTLRADGPAWVAASDGAQLKITALGTGWRIEQCTEEDRAWRKTTSTLRQSRSVQLNAGESVSAVTVLQAEKNDDGSFYHAALTSSNELMLTLPQGNSAPIRVVWGAAPTDSVANNAPAMIVRGNEIKLPRATRVTEPAVSAKADAETAVMDESARWHVAWQYRGLQRPAPITTATNLSGDTLDLGRVYDLAEISIRDRSNDQRGELPKEIATSVDGSTWRMLDDPREWRPALLTGNYGRGEPVEHGYQVIKPRNLKARYVRGKDVQLLRYYQNDELVAREPLRLELVDFNGDGKPQIFAKSDIWPAYRWLREEDASLAVITTDGQEVFQYDVPTNLQAARALEWEAPGKKQVVLLTSDAKVRIFKPDGKMIREWNLYAMHQEFNKKYGRPNTRHPAGGYTMPSSVGMWRRLPPDPAKLVIGRYGYVDFLNERGELEGVLAGGSYWNPGMLTQGVDFNGDGAEEMLGMGANSLLHMDGDNKPYVAEPNGDQFYPQVYRQQTVVLPEGDDRPGLGGAPILIFQTLSWGGGTPRFVLIVRENCLCIYDAKERKWIFHWVPIVPMTAAAITVNGADSLKLLASTKDGLLWELSWQGTLEKLDKFESRPGPLPRRITALPKELPGQALLSTAQGAYIYAGMGRIELIQSGSFRDAVFFGPPPNRRLSVIATTDRGEIIRLDGPER